MRAFRVAATLAHVTPQVRIRVRDCGRVMCTVSSTPPEDGDGAHWLRPSTFRAVVGRAYRHQRRGARPLWLDAPAGGDLAIDIGLRAGDCLLPGDIYRIGTVNGQCLLLFLTDLGPEACRRAVAEAMTTTNRCDAQENGGTVAARRIGFHADVLTEVTVVHTMCARDDAERATPVMGRLLEVCTAAEAIAQLHGQSMPFPDSRP